MSMVLVVNDGSMCPRLLSLINSKFEVEVRNPSEALEILRMSRGGARGFDLVIAYAHKCQPNVTKLKNFIKSEFDQQLPIVCFKCIAVEGFDELNGMPACHLIDKWKSDTKRKGCQLKWTEQLNFIFFLAVDSLSLRGDEVTAGRVLMCMKDIQQGLQLTERQVNSHLQKYRKFLSHPQRENILARDFEKYRKLQNEDLANMGQAAIAAQMQYTTDGGMQHNSSGNYVGNVTNTVGDQRSLAQNHNPTFGDNNSSYPPTGSGIGNQNENLADMDQAITAQMQFTTDSGINDYYASQNPNMPMFDGQGYSTGDANQQQGVNGLSCPMSQTHNLPFGGNNSSYPPYPTQSNEQQQFQASLVSNGGMQHNSSANYYLDNQLNIDQCPLTQQIPVGFAMDNNYNESVHPQPWQENMASIALAPWPQINSNSDIVGTSQQQSLNQHYSPQLDWRF